MNAPHADPPGPSPTIERIDTLGTDGLRARVLLSNGAELRMSVDIVLQLQLRSGNPVDAQLRARLEDHDLHHRAREKSLSLLSRRPRSRRELADRLRRGDVPAGVIERVLDRLEDSGYLNDGDFARAFIRDRLRFRPRGRRALNAELRRKGVAAEVIDAALDDAFREMHTTDRAVADEVAEGWIRRQPQKILGTLRKGPFDEDGAKAWRRGLGHLARKGFGSGVARAALERALAQR